MAYLMQTIQQKGQELLCVVLCKAHELIGLVGHQLLQHMIHINVNSALYLACASLPALSSFVPAVTYDHYDGIVCAQFKSM